MDPRLSVIERRLQSAGRVIAVAGNKGGVGKSTVAACLALVLSRQRRCVGLLDLDFYGPSGHLILGAEPAVPREDRGIKAPRVHGIEFMSIVHFAGRNPAPLRGADISNALIELLAITRWGSLDDLIVDMPPGIGDATLDVVRLLKRARFLVVTTSSILAMEGAGKLIALLAALDAAVLGVIENMRRSGDPPLAPGLLDGGARILGSLPFDPQLEEALGDPEKLGRTDFSGALKDLVARHAGLI